MLSNYITGRDVDASPPSSAVVKKG